MIVTIGDILYTKDIIIIIATLKTYAEEESLISSVYLLLIFYYFLLIQLISLLCINVFVFFMTCL